ncbi:MAG TPA: hypothetical protein VKZ75_03820 [Cyclobacteriaceae bacterium]|nr:hypothetical protein [Cyclobacteriaceae bacterium]
MTRISIVAFCLFGLLAACGTEKESAGNAALFEKDNLVAWCVVPFDSTERTPEERAQMLHELGFSKFAYDWRLKHLDSFTEEVNALKKNGIEMSSVWFWINGEPGKVIDDVNERILGMIRDNNIKTELWVSFNNSYFEGLDDEGKLDKAVSAVRYIRDRAQELGCTVALYNHGDWFGEPGNQVKIIEKLGTGDVSIVYNFHHARHQVERFPELLQMMMPYLSTINLNGMRPDGPMILPLGQGDLELGMLKTLKASGYDGAIGILGHVEDADVRVILDGNLQGLKSLLGEMGETEALATY